MSEGSQSALVRWPNPIPSPMPENYPPNMDGEAGESFSSHTQYFRVIFIFSHILDYLILITNL